MTQRIETTTTTQGTTNGSQALISQDEMGRQVENLSNADRTPNIWNTLILECFRKIFTELQNQLAVNNQAIDFVNHMSQLNKTMKQQNIDLKKQVQKLTMEVTDKDLKILSLANKINKLTTKVEEADNCCLRIFGCTII